MKYSKRTLVLTLCLALAGAGVADARSRRAVAKKPAKPAAKVEVAGPGAVPTVVGPPAALAAPLVSPAAPRAAAAKPRPKRPHTPDAYFVLQKELVIQLAARDLEKAEEACRAQILLRPDRGLPYYNLATVHTLRGHLDRAFECLFRAADKGFVQPELVRADPDLAPLRAHPLYPHLLDQMSRAAAPVTMAGGAAMGSQAVAQSAR